MVGSDQLWLPVKIAGGYFTLEWVEPPVRRISYATSLLENMYIEKTDSCEQRYDIKSVIRDGAKGFVCSISEAKNKEAMSLYPSNLPAKVSRCTRYLQHQGYMGRKYAKFCKRLIEQEVFSLEDRDVSSNRVHNEN